jgi:Na+:H+ antiporter, NhaA family
MSAPRTPHPRTWIASERPVPRLIARPLREFLATESAGGLVLLAVTVGALVWTNSPLSASYGSLWATDLSVGLGRHSLAMDLRHWVNEGLMTVFFFVVGLEIKRELDGGELGTIRKASFPVLAALGGMIFPALIYVAINGGSAAARGWGIPMATDIAFAVGVLTLLGPRIKPSLKIFLLSLAVADDIGTIAVIAIYYSGGVRWVPLVIAVLLIAAVVGLRRLDVWWTPAYVVVGLAAWLATLSSGLSTTVVGVVLGLLTPARALHGGDSAELPEPSPEAPYSAPGARRLELRARHRVPVAEQLEHVLHPWSSFLIVPLFALANVGVSLSWSALGAALSSPVALSVIAGRLAGKTLGITSFAWLSRRLGIAELPEGVTWMEITGVAAIAGVGFTIPLFVTALAFEADELVAAAKIGILAGSVLGCALGATILSRTRAHARDD